MSDSDRESMINAISPQSANTPNTFANEKIHPPKAPPAKIPKNCDEEYMPIAAPLFLAGAIFETSDGSVASSKVNAIKKINNNKIVIEIFL